MPECGGLGGGIIIIFFNLRMFQGVTSHRTDFPKCKLVVHAKDRQHGLETNNEKKITGKVNFPHVPNRVQFVNVTFL